MPFSSSPRATSAIVSRLRAAGCVFAEDEAAVLVAAAKTPAALAAMVDRRVDGLPLEYVVGWAEFCGLRVAVDEGVFVPRHRTEHLVECAVARGRPGAVVVDLCCGSGALGAAVAAALGDVELHAVDIDPRAVACARRNLAQSNAGVYLGDLYEGLPATRCGRADIILANVPYVPSAEVAMLPREARDYESRAALDGGVDGLDIARRVAAGAGRWLAPGGHLLIETTERQAPVAVEFFLRSGLVAQVERADELDATVVIGTRSELSIDAPMSGARGAS